MSSRRAVLTRPTVTERARKAKRRGDESESELGGEEEEYNRLMEEMKKESGKGREEKMEDRRVRE
jgi:hypothetical protein